ncbi:MAG: zf-HC2 domain-containing protein [Anaerolineae bacterium]|nr:MAG: zf-HC2 domain-containing protein [Anaerolineae bacterium]
MVNDLDRTSTPAGNISDELLSAYLDGEVTPEERTLVERSIASNSDVAWRLGALRQTVAIVGQLPRVPLPRSFTLREADVRPTRRQARCATLVAGAAGPSFYAVPARWPPCSSWLYWWAMLCSVVWRRRRRHLFRRRLWCRRRRPRGMSNMAGAGASTDEGAAAKVAPSTESEVTLPPAEAAPMATTEALVMVAPTPSADAHSTGPAVEPNPTREAVAAGAATLPAAAAAYPATTPTPAPTPTDDAAATPHCADARGNRTG